MWDDEIQAIQEMLSFAQARRNELVPCSSLPPELLGRVFEFLLLPKQHRELTKHRHSWVAVTHVCKRWRTIALGHAALWSTISTVSKQPWDIFLQRSRTSLLSISASMSDSTPEYSQYIAEHLHRVRVLSLQTLSHIDQSILTSLLGATTAPELQVLRLRRTGHSSQVLPPEFFSEVAPNVREIKLENFQFPWTTIAPHIVSLDVSAEWAVPTENGTRLRKPDFFTMQDILQCLSRMPNLRTLSLARLPNSLPLIRITSGGSHEPDLINLPHLTKIHLAGQVRPCVRFWRLLRAHPQVQVLMRTSQSFHEGVLKDVISSLKDRLYAPDYPTLTKISLEMNNNSLLSFSVRAAPIPREEPDYLSTDYHSLEIISKSPSSAPAQLAATMALFSTIRLPRIRHLDFAHSEGWSAEEWEPLLSSIPSVESLAISNMSPFQFEAVCQALIMPAIEDQPPILPALDRLLCTRLNLNTRSCFDLGAVANVFMSHIAYRADLARRRTPRTVVLKDCTIHEKSVHMMRSIVDILDWDGITDGCDNLEWEDNENEDEDDEDGEDA
jgi:hypothetical protein